jgi:hypothetical protein
MNKDALLATLIGFGIGLFITGMILVGPRLAKYLPKVSFNLPQLFKTGDKKAPAASPTPAEFTVTIDSPIADSIESEDTILVSGTTAAEATVVIQGEINDAAALTKTDGKYAGRVDLVEGRNDITVTSYQKDKTATQTITVFYTPEEL